MPSPTTYTVTSDRLSRPFGETFTFDELGEANIAALVAGGHLAPTRPTRKPGHPATDKQEK
jgi:hypothetical protein